MLFLTPTLLSNVKFSSTRRPPSSPAKVISPPKQTRRCNTSSLTSTLKACKKGGNNSLTYNLSPLTPLGMIYRRLRTMLFHLRFERQCWMYIVRQFSKLDNYWHFINNYWANSGRPSKLLTPSLNVNCLT